MAVSLLPMWLLLLSFGGAPLPLSLPPLPEDPAISAVAPQDCLFYMSLAGAAEPDPKSKNQTEQLLAEKQIQQFGHSIEAAVIQAVRKQAHGREDTVAALEIPNLVKILLTRPAAVFISDVQVGPRGPDIHAGLVINAGDRAREMTQSIENLEALAPAGAIKDVGDWKQIQPPEPDAPLFQWGWKGKYLIIAIGEGTADGAAKRLSGQPPAWLAALRKQLSVERPAIRQHQRNYETGRGSGPRRPEDFADRRRPGAFERQPTRNCQRIGGRRLRHTVVACDGWAAHGSIESLRQ